MHELRADVDVQPPQVGTRRTSSSASSGGRPNFEPRCAVFTASCVSASIPGVTRTRNRSAPAACALRARRASRGRGGARLRRAPQQLVLLVVAVHHEPFSVDPRAQGERELAGGGDVGAEPFLGEQPQQRDRRERLRPVHDERSGAACAVRASLVSQRLVVVDDEGRAVAARELRRAHAADDELAVVDAGGIGKQLASRPGRPTARRATTHSDRTPCGLHHRRRCARSA